MPDYNILKAAIRDYLLDNGSLNTQVNSRIHWGHLTTLINFQTGTPINNVPSTTTYFPAVTLELLPGNTFASIIGDVDVRLGTHSNISYDQSHSILALVVNILQNQLLTAIKVNLLIAGTPIELYDPTARLYSVYQKLRVVWIHG